MTNEINKKNIKAAFMTVNFFKRVITALLMGGLTLWILMTESPYIGYFMTCILVIVILEWMKLIFSSNKLHRERMIWLVFGGAYLSLGLLGFYEFYDYSPLLGIGLLFLIWSTDTGAYFVGKIVGGPKLAPSISPGKTWSGAFGGLISAIITTLIISYYIYTEFNWPFVSFFILCAILSQIGDLIESKVKRYFDAKDSSSLLPGHGGFLDRLDSIIFVGVILYMLYLLPGFAKIFHL